MNKYRFYLWPLLIGIFNAVSEASNQGHITLFWPSWFGPDSWMNKYTWFWGYGKYWPLIVFTDAFHFFKTCWVVCMSYGFLLSEQDQTTLPINRAVLSFIVYSVSFQMVYSLL